jgi:hypothetical protein
MALTKANNRMIDGAEINVLDYGAIGDGVADDTAAIQAALNASKTSKVVFPVGKYKVTDTLVVTYDTGSGAVNWGSVNLEGRGFGSNIQWQGANNKPVIQYVGLAGDGWYSNTIIEGLHISVENSATGVTGILLGDTSDGGSTTGVGNVSIRNNIIYSCDIGIHTWSESDEITIEDNHIRVHQTYGIKNEGGSGYLIQRNHIQDGDAGSIGVYSEKTAITIKNNVIQSYTNINAISLDGVRGFNVSDNYSESVVTNSDYFVQCQSCSAGYIGQNEMGGYINADLIKIVTSSDIQIGSNSHSQSGGFINSLVNIDGSSTGIGIIGKQATSGSVTTIIGDPVLYVQGAVNQGLKFFTNSGVQTLDALGGANDTKVLFSISAGQAYLVFASEANSGSTATGMFVSNGVATTAEYFSIGSTGGTGISLAANGLNLEATNNNAGSQVTVGWNAIRIY